MRPLVALLVVWAVSNSAVADDERRLSDPYFGEAFFHAHQGDYFSAIERLDAELDQYQRLEVYHEVY